MNTCKLILFCFLINACKEKHIINSRVEPAIHLPSIYLPSSSEKLAFSNDVLLLNGKKYAGYLYAQNPISKDTILLQGYYNGLLEGTCKKWFLNNQLMECRLYHKGKKNGKQIAYWDNGNKRFEFVAVDDAYEGELKEWAYNGHLLHLANYINGQESGVQKLWYDNGKIRANYVIIKGKRYGLLGTKNCKNVSDSIFNIK